MCKLYAKPHVKYSNKVQYMLIAVHCISQMHYIKEDYLHFKV